MRKMMGVLAVLVASAAFADEQATSVCVIETSKLEAMVKVAGSVEKITTEALWEAGWHGFLDGKIDAQYERDGATFHFAAARADAGVLYALNVVRKPQIRLEGSMPSERLFIGLIPTGEAVKKDWQSEPFVIVLRKGNFKLE